MTEIPIVAIIGFGQAGEAFSRHLSARAEIRVYDQLLASGPRAAGLSERLAGARVAPCESLRAALAGAPLALSLVTASVSLEVARQAGALLPSGALFIDLNSSPPAVKARSAEAFPGGGYVDGAILGSVALERHQVPMALSGPRAEEAASILNRLGLASRFVGPGIGAASALKVCRSVVMKGLECLLIEALLAADRYDIAGELLASVGETIASRPFSEVAQMLVTTHAVHAGRRAGEMVGVSEALEGLEVPPLMSQASLERLSLSASRLPPQGRRPDSIEQVIEALRAS